jgi:hypothetical protein
MNVLAVSGPRHANWRWRIVDHAGATAEASPPGPPA